MEYKYLGDRFTDPLLKGQSCKAIHRANGKCIRGRNGSMLVEFESGRRHYYTIIAMSIPKEHQLVCKGCGKVLDMRDTSVLAHGWIEDGKIVCYDAAPPIPYTSSKKVGDSVEWTHDKKPVHLN